MSGIREILRSTFFLTAGLFAVLLLAWEAGLVPRDLNFPYFVLALVLLAIAARPWQDTKGSSFPLAPIVLMVAFGLALGLRLGLSLQHPVLLGYDPGLYRYVFNLYIDHLPSVPEAGLPEWIRSTYPQGLPLLVAILHVLTGLMADDFMRYVFPVISAALVVPLYILARQVFGPRAAGLSAILYALSYTQLNTFGLMYLKNVLGLSFMLLAFYAAHRRMYVLFGLLLAGIGLYHRPTLLVAGLVSLAYLAATRDRRIVVSLALAGVITLPLVLLRWDTNWALIKEALAATASAVGQGTPGAGGTFFDISRYRWVSLAYQPFALIAALGLIARREWNIPLVFLLVGGTLVAVEAFFFRRHLIPLDIAMVLLGGKGLEMVFWRGTGLLRPVGWLCMAALIAAAGLLGVRYYTDTRPLITSEQLGAIQWIAKETPPDAGVVASSYDAPWVLGWSGRRVIAPGLFHWNQHNREEWLSFLATREPEEAQVFLNRYDAPLYVYYSGQPRSVIDLAKFQAPFFRVVYQHDGVRIFEYTPHSGAGDQ